MKYTRLLMMICIMAGTLAASAQSEKRLSLQEAIDLSIKNSKQLKSRQAQVDEAIASVGEAADARLPSLSVSGSYLHLNSPHISLSSGKDSAGGGSGQSTPKVSQAAYGIVNLALPIYSGGKIRYGIESAKYLQKAAQLDADNDKEGIAINTINAYSNLYKANAAVNIVRENLKQANQRVKDFSNLEKNGLLARNDLLKAQLQASNVELSLLEAESNARVAAVNMDLMIGLPEETALTTDSIGYQPPAGTRSILDWENTAMQSRKDLAALALREKASNTAIKIAIADYYPSLALTGGYIAAYVPHLLTVTNAMNVGVGVQYNLSFWKAKSRIQQAKARVQQVQANEEILSDAVRLQINQAYQSHLLSQRKIDVYAKAVEQAAENYRITKNKYDNSLVTTTDLLDADVAQLQAKLNYEFSKADAMVAYNQLLEAAGILNTTATK
ncbi:MAG: TolC family protein [Williamsia sp.]|nr:TolC family protein [Williamsia sp.]